MSHKSKLYPVLMLLLVCSCRKSATEDFLTVETTQLIFSAMVNSRTIPCASNAEINAVSSQPWCTATIIDNGKTILVRAEKNDGVGADNVRTAIITVTAGKAEAVRIEVKQLSEDRLPEMPGSL